MSRDDSSSSFLRGVATGCALTALLMATLSLVFRGLALSVDVVVDKRKTVAQQEDLGLLQDGRSLLGFWGEQGTHTTADGLDLQFPTKSIAENNPPPPDASSERKKDPNSPLKSAKKELLVVVTSSRILLERTCNRIRRTWGRDTAEYRVVVGINGASNDTVNVSSPNILFSSTHGDFPALPYLTFTNITSLLDITRKHFLGEYKWFIFVPSNVYVAVRRLERFLKRLNPDVVAYLGHPKHFGSSEGPRYCEGGPGIVLSDAALGRLDRECERGTKGGLGPGYARLGKCLVSKLKTECAMATNVRHESSKKNKHS